MGLNWTEIAAEAAAETDRELAGDISSLTTMTDGEIEELFPAPQTATGPTHGDREVS